jgi:23S rRNA maturation mini-RNase III
LIVVLFWTKRLSMIKRKQNKKTNKDQKETEQKDYQWSKGNRTKRLSMIKRKQNKRTINDQKETEQKDYQWSKRNRTKRLSMIKRKFPFDHW